MGVKTSLPKRWPVVLLHHLKSDRVMNRGEYSGKNLAEGADSPPVDLVSAMARILEKREGSKISRLSGVSRNGSRFAQLTKRATGWCCKSDGMRWAEPVYPQWLVLALKNEATSAEARNTVELARLA